MSTGSAKALFAAVLATILAGCAAGQPQPILSAAELDAMIRVEVERIEPQRPDARMIVAAQP